MNLNQTRFATLPALLFATVLPAGPAAAGDPDAGARKAIYCAYCHGFDGNPLDDEAPRLAGRSEASLVDKLNQPALYQQKNHLMIQAFMGAGCISERDIADLAAYFARQTARARPRFARPASSANQP